MLHEKLRPSLPGPAQSYWGAGNRLKKTVRHRGIEVGNTPEIAAQTEV